MLATDRYQQPITFSEQLWTSRSSAWAGYELEQHRVGPKGELREFEVNDFLLGVCVAGSAKVEVGDDNDASRAVMRAGHLILLVPGPQPKPIAWLGDRQTLYVHLDADRMARLAVPLLDMHHSKPAAQYAIWDPQAYRLSICMRDEVRAGCPAGPLYSQSLSLALTQHLWSRYAVERPDSGFRAVLGGEKRKRVQSYIEAHLHRGLTLIDLAEVVDLSPHYFAQVFKNTYGTTPHRYVIGLRVEAAKRRLKDDGSSITDIGLSLGFADQSHFTSVFRRSTGRTPHQFRQDR
jgi:AraC family transcriptional regulator